MRAVIVLLLVHSWYDPSCCGGKDCHPVPCDEITIMHNGDYLWHHGLEHATFNRNQMKPSQDDSCHVCVLPDATQSGVCIYLPAKV